MKATRLNTPRVQSTKTPQPTASPAIPAQPVGKAVVVTDGKSPKVTPRAHGELPPETAPFVPVDLDALAAEVNQILSTGESSAMKAGELIFHSLFGGNVEVFKRKQHSEKYLKELLARDDIAMNKPTLSKALRVAAQRRELPETARELPYTLQADLLVIKDPKQRSELALVAVEENLSRSELAPRIAVIRAQSAKPPKPSNPVKALSQVLKSIKALGKAIDLGVIPASLFEDESFEAQILDIGAELEAIRQWHEELLAALNTAKAETDAQAAAGGDDAQDEDSEVE